MNFWRWCLSLVCAVAFFGLLGSGLSVIAGGDKDKKEAKDAKKDEKKDEKKDVKDKKDEKKDKKDEKKDEKDKKGEKKDDKEAKNGKKQEAKDYVWQAFEKEFHQELKTVTDQDLSVMDQKIKQKQEQTFHITWTPKEKKDGNWVVEQRIDGMKMSIDIGGNKITYDSYADKIPNNPMSDFFNNLKGATLTYHISPELEIKKIEGQKALIDKLSQTNPQMRTLLDTLLSEDALKQMAQPTWGAFPPDDRKDNSWTRDVKLNLGNIGSYTSKLQYKINEKDKNKIDIASTLEYSAPEKDAKAPKLPFTIKEAKTQKMKAAGTGTAVFDPEKGRFSKVEMNTKIEGLELVIEVGNVDTTVTVNQTQNSTVTTSDTPFHKGKEKETTK